jgi:methyltransferase (TIGR00027 family)
MTTPPLPEGVGLTALTTAYARAQESRRAAPLFTDPLAALFVAEAAGKTGIAGAPLPPLGPARDYGASPLWDSIYSHVTGRTPFYDSFVSGAVASGCRQVVLLGAGLDVRAFRLPLDPGTTVYEVDTPAVLEFKAGVLARHAAKPGVKRVPVGTDLRDDWPGDSRPPDLIATNRRPGWPRACCCILRQPRRTYFCQRSPHSRRQEVCLRAST